MEEQFKHLPEISIEQAKQDWLVIIEPKLDELDLTNVIDCMEIVYSFVS